MEGAEDADEIYDKITQSPDMELLTSKLPRLLKKYFTSENYKTIKLMVQFYLVSKNMDDLEMVRNQQEYL